MSKLTSVLAFAAILLVLMQVYLHNHSISTDPLSAAETEAAMHARQMQLMAGLNVTLLALHSELHEIAQLHKQVTFHAQQEKDEAQTTRVILPINKNTGTVQAATELLSVHREGGKDTSRRTGGAGDDGASSGGESGASKDKLSAVVADSRVSSSKSGINSRAVSPLLPPARPRRALVFTMDSISAYEEDSRRGGAAGEIRVRESLQAALKQLGVDVKTIRSDAEFDTQNGALFDFIIVDPWTWAARGWVPKLPLRGQDEKVYVLDFFGSPKLKGTGLNVPANHFLTAFGSPWNAFLGYSMAAAVDIDISTRPKKNQGVIWGKDPKHFAGKERMLHRVADSLAALPSERAAILVSTAHQPVFQHEKVKWIGHQTGARWNSILRESKFLIGLGDPLLGPSALDAMAAGCMYINPTLERPVKGSKSQHPWAEEHVGEPYVCSYKENDAESLNACISKALSANLPPLVPTEFTSEVYRERVKSIFGL